MIKIKHSTRINAPADKVWDMMWDYNTYCQWTRPFSDGSYAVSDWKQGSKVHFLVPSGGGMYSKISRMEKNKCMVFKPIGEIKNFEELEPTDEMKSWQEGAESYFLEEENGSTLLTVELDTIEQYADMFNDAFPKSLEIIKQLSEDKLKPAAMAAACINAPLEKVWEYRTKPEHIIRWNAASDDWHTTEAHIDLKAGGKFNYRMESKDGAHGFNFEGSFTLVEPKKHIAYVLADERQSIISFNEHNGKVTVVEYFELENTNPADMQRAGWQAIMDNFKQYTEQQ